MIYYGLVIPPSFDPFHRLRTFSANVRLNFHLIRAQGSCWYLVLANQLQLLSPRAEHITMILHPDQECWGKQVSYSSKYPTLCSEGFGWTPKGSETPQRLEDAQLTCHFGKSFPGRKAGGWIG